MSKNVPAYILFNKIFQLEGLQDIYHQFIHDNTVSGVDRMVKRVFDKDIHNHLITISRKVLNGTYKFTPYKEKLFIKTKDSNPRVISIPTIRDKIVLKGLQRIIKESFSLEQPLVQTIIGEMKSELTNYNSFIRIDIKNFFDNVNHILLEKKLNRRIRKPLIKNLILSAIRTPTVSQNSLKRDRMFSNVKGVPQGLSISNALAEVFLQDLDKNHSKNKNYKYFRYVDDILILCNEGDIPKIKERVINDISRNYKLEVNKSKCTQGRIDKDGFEFLGYRVTKLASTGSIGLTIKKSAKLKFEKSIVDMFTRYKYTNTVSPREFVFYLNNKITGSISKKVNGNSDKEKKYGWVFFYSQIDDIQVFYHFDWFIKKLISDFKFEENFNGLEIKSFVKTYYEVIYNRSKTKYIHRPDNLTTEEKKKLLMEVFNIRERFLVTDEQIDRFYYAKVYKPIKLLEKDVQDIS